MIEFSFLGWAITNILVNGSIFDPLRIYLQVMYPTLGKLVTCMQCSGFWVGILFGLFISSNQMVNPFMFLLEYEGYLFQTLTILFSGFWISGASVGINSVLIYLIKPKPAEIHTNV
jgi:hypothetical protein